MFFSYPQDFKERELVPGVTLRLVWGERIMLSHATFEPKCKIPVHSHQNEQAGIVIEGKMALTIGDKTRICNKGDAFTIPGNVEHSVVNGDKETIVIDTFSPPRDDYK